MLTEKPSKFPSNENQEICSKETWELDPRESNVLYRRENTRGQNLDLSYDDKRTCTM